MTSNKNLTEGVIWKQLFVFALPLLASGLIQQLYNTVDLIFAGNLLGKEAAAAIGASSLLVACMVGFFTGMSISSNVLAARYFGAKKYAELKSVISMAFFLSIAGGLILTLIGYALTPVMLRWLEIPDSIYDLAVAYLRTYILSLISMAGYNIGCGVLRGLGNSRSPMLYQLIGGIGNIAANALFIGVFHWGVRGVAIATLVSQSTAAILVFCHLYRFASRYGECFKQLHLSLAVLKKFVKIGFPAGIQAMTLTLSNLIVQNHINKLGVDAIAAFTVYFKVELFVYLPIVAVGQANVTFTSQNMGAKLPDRATKGTITSLFLGMTITFILSVLLLLLREPSFRLFTTDSTVIEIGKQIALIAVPFYFLYVFLEVFASYVRGIGRTLPPTLIILANMCLIRPIYVSVISNICPSAQAIAWVYPLTWLTTSICMTLIYIYTKKRVALTLIEC